MWQNSRPWRFSKLDWTCLSIPWDLMCISIFAFIQCFTLIFGCSSPVSCCLQSCLNLYESTILILLCEVKAATHTILLLPFLVYSRDGQLTTQRCIHPTRQFCLVPWNAGSQKTNPTHGIVYVSWSWGWDRSGIEVRWAVHPIIWLCLPGLQGCD